MTETPRHIISANQALAIILSGQILQDVSITDKLDLSKFHKDNFETDIVAHNCIFEYLEASCVEFKGKVEFSNCVFKKCQFVFTYFPG